ncbi:polyprenyl synthetase family protein [Thermopetrobacter sp. TC1]|uniref:polyprenyl synthetase family protein n=1 Tax=Thermopetrobacter sp. TC1 TaxID=1495045 RepID=UPI00056F3FFE|nr:farnesyl diphosphate synthase [Thermopetrobacter sp. TC1]
MSFLEALKKTARDVDTLLDELIPLKGAAAPRVVEAMRYAALGAGKRIRPFFVRESARILGADDRAALRTGAALECVHCYSLVHDDLPAMDDDDLRRGRPTVHKQFDEATAILAGDGLLTHAFFILAREETHPNAAVRAELIAALAQAAGHEGMVGGQMLDLQAEEAPSHAEEDVLRIQRLKTGALFRFALLAGAILAQAGAEDRRRMQDYADAVGLAFQIADDILDVEATPEELGKATGKDAEAGKATFVDLYGVDGARKRAEALVERAIAAVDPYGPRADLLREAARFIIERRK